MITAHDMAIGAAPTAPRPATPRPALAAAQPVPAAALPFRERLLLVVLYITVLASSLAFIEPSPHDGLMAVLAVACLVAGVRFERPLILLLMLLVMWNVAGLVALINVVAEENTVTFAATSLYLAVAALLFACLFAQNTMMRLATLRSAYIATAIFTVLFGLAVYVNLLPGQDIFLWSGRVRSTFKDPNVFGPFLILPMLFMIEGMMARGIRPHVLFATFILLTGLLFSFSRGAWINFIVSAAAMLALLVLTGKDRRARLRPIVLGVVSVSVVVIALGALMTIDSVRTMLLERAQLTQSYDVGSGGRFFLQEIALRTLFEHPLGLGPFEFSRIYGLQQHNVYLQAFLVYGWAGGVSYIALLAMTLFVGLRNAFIHTPWQGYLIAACAALIGNIVESIVIDSDHWRHFFLILGLIWGLSAATVNRMRAQRMSASAQPGWATS